MLPSLDEEEQSIRTKQSSVEGSKRGMRITTRVPTPPKLRVVPEKPLSTRKSVSRSNASTRAVDQKPKPSTLQQRPSQQQHTSQKPRTIAAPHGRKPGSTPRNENKPSSRTLTNKPARQQLSHSSVASSKPTNNRRFPVLSEQQKERNREPSKNRIPEPVSYWAW
jgi:hypothetical protein